MIIKRLFKFVNGVTVVTLGFYLLIGYFLYSVLWIKSVNPLDQEALGWLVALGLTILAALGDHMFMKLHIMYCDKCEMFDIAVADLTKITKQIERLKEEYDGKGREKESTGNKK